MAGKIFLKQRNFVKEGLYLNMLNERVKESIRFKNERHFVFILNIVLTP